MKSDKRKIRLSVGYSIGPSVWRALKLLKHAGLTTTTAISASVIEDLYVQAYDRHRGVRTSGYIPLS